jgi:ATP synthase F1 epsilon subunit
MPRQLGNPSVHKKKMNLQVSILTPEKPFWDGEAEEIILPAETGEMGILKNHAPIVCGLSVGAMLIRTKQEWQSVAIMGGFALVKKNQVTILANEAFAAESIDAEEARTTFEQAKTNLETSAGIKDKVEANFAYKRAKARFQVVQASKTI